MCGACSGPKLSACTQCSSVTRCYSNSNVVYCDIVSPILWVHAVMIGGMMLVLRVGVKGVCYGRASWASVRHGRALLAGEG